MENAHINVYLVRLEAAARGAVLAVRVQNVEPLGRLECSIRFWHMSHL
jgi:hypothetical protein